MRPRGEGRTVRSAIALHSDWRHFISDARRNAIEGDPLAGSSWSDPRTVDGFVHSAPNGSLVNIAARALQPAARLLDIGCGAGRNAIPLARLGWRVAGVDLSRAMLRAAAARPEGESPFGRVDLVLAPMEWLPFEARTFEFVVAHGIWNLARSGSQFRRAVREAARVARPGALLFVFTFSRHTLPDDIPPVAGESFVFTQFSGEPQCFLTEEQLVAELADAGFHADASHPLRELNRRQGSLSTGAPVIYEGLFRRDDAFS